MATCKKCVHNEVCKYGENRSNGLYCTGEKCEQFKDRSRFVELPCNIGDTVYVITYCRCGKPECYDKQHCFKKETARTPKVLASKMVQQLGWKTVWSMYGGIDKQKSGWQPKGTICYRVYQKTFEMNMLADVGKTVFLTIEEAEKALAEKE